MRIYSDAFLENGHLRLGYICFPPDRRRLGGTCFIPPEIIAAWNPRQINSRSSLARHWLAFWCLWFHPQILSNRNILWFIDNKAAASSLIRGSSKEQDVHAIAQFYHLLHHHLQCRVWIEWVDSQSNTSDGLSRLGLLDPWARDQDWDLAECLFPDDLFPSTFLSAFLDHLDLSDSG